MIKKHNNLSLSIGIPGIIIQAYGAIAHIPIIQLAGTILVLIGFYYYAKAKGRHPAFCLLAFLSIIGLMILACLKDESGSDEVPSEGGTAKGCLIIFLIFLLVAIGLPLILKLLGKA